MSLVRAMASGDLPAGAPTAPALRRVTVGRTEVLLARLQSGQVVAFAAACPHEGTSLQDATFWDGKVRCPRHLYLYDPRSGENVLPAREAKPENLWKLKPGYLPVHRVEERDGWIWVDDAPRPPPPAYDPALERRPPGARRSVAVIPPPEPEPPAGPVEHPAETVRVRAGEVLELRLPTAPRPGHAWRVEVSGTALGLVGQVFEPDPEPTVTVRLSAPVAGEATVRCAYLRPWDGPEAAAEVRRYEVEIGPAG